MESEKLNGNEYFKSLVAKDVRGDCSNQESSILNENIRDWIDELNILLRDVDIQLRDHKAILSAKHAECVQESKKIEWLWFKAEQDKWLVKALRFRASVEERLRHAKTIRAQLNGAKISLDEKTLVNT